LRYAEQYRPDSSTYPDLVLLGMQGWSVASAVKTQRPKQWWPSRLSGHSESAIRTARAWTQPRVFLAKPISQEGLAHHGERGLGRALING